MVTFIVLTLSVLWSFQSIESHSISKQVPSFDRVKPEDHPQNVLFVAARNQSHSNNDLPWQTVLCGGSIITEQLVLTTARCVVNSIFLYANKTDVKVIVGVNNITILEKYINENNPNHQYDVDLTYIEKEHFWNINGSNDIALVRVKTPFKFNEKVKSIALPKSKEELKIKQQALAVGLQEETNFFLPSYSALIGIKVEIVDDKYCKERFNIKDSWDLLCVKSNINNTCLSELGSGLIVNRNGVKTLYGVLSLDDPICSFNEMKFTSVVKHLDYIEKVIANKEKGVRASEIETINPNTETKENYISIIN